MTPNTAGVLLSPLLALGLIWLGVVALTRGSSFCSGGPRRSLSFQMFLDKTDSSPLPPRRLFCGGWGAK